MEVSKTASLTVSIKANMKASMIHGRIKEVFQVNNVSHNFYIHQTLV